MKPDFRSALAHLLNSYSAENGSNTPDYLLADYLIMCLGAYDVTVEQRAKWYGRMDCPGGGITATHDTPQNGEVR